MKKSILIALCVISTLYLASCGTTVNPAGAQTNKNKVNITVTFNALKEFAQAVGGDKVEIGTIIPDGMEAHDFEPKAQDLANLSTADIFVYNGLNMESWAEEAAQSANNEDLIVVNASEGADLIEREAEQHQESEETEGNGEQDHGKYDPHLWLSLKGAQTETENIRDALILADPENKEYYESNCASFTAQLTALYDEYSNKFSSLTNKAFVTGHAAFGYLCRDFGLTQESVSDIFAEGEPSAQQLTELVEYCRNNHVTAIFAEEMASPAVSQTLANEVGAKVETIYTIENSEDGKSYIERMKDNLDKIYTSLA